MGGLTAWFYFQHDIWEWNPNIVWHLPYVSRSGRVVCRWFGDGIAWFWRGLACTWIGIAALCLTPIRVVRWHMPEKLNPFSEFRLGDFMLPPYHTLHKTSWLIIKTSRSIANSWNHDTGATCWSTRNLFFFKLQCLLTQRVLPSSSLLDPVRSDCLWPHLFCG